MKNLDNEYIVPYLHREYFEKLPYLTVAHPKIVVLFSGGNAVGKSTLSRRIQTELQAVVIENDALRNLMIQYEPELVHDREKLGNVAWRYTQDLFPKLAQLTVNGLIVRDAVIDWTYEKILPLFEAQGYALFIVRFELSREKRRELVRTRGGKEWISSELLESQFDSHETYGKKFLEHYTPDIVLTDETLFDYDIVLNALSKKLDSLRDTADIK